MLVSHSGTVDATRHVLYHYRGTASLEIRSGGSVRSLSRSIDIQKRLLDQWSMVGPFAPGQAPELGDTLITPATLHKSYEGMDGKTVSWMSWQSAVKNQNYASGRDYLRGRKRWIDVQTVYPDNHASAVAVTWVKSPAPVTGEVSVRHNDGIELWINRQQILNSPATEGVYDLTGPPPGVVKVPLHEGWNQVVVKTDHGAKDWGFSVRLHLPPGVVCEQSAEPPVRQMPAR